MRKEIEKFIIHVIADVLYITEEEVEPDMSLSDDLGVDSLEMHGIFAKIGAEYDLPLNIINITRNITSIFEKMDTGNPLDILSAVGEEMQLEFSENNYEDFSSLSFNVNKGLLIKSIMSYITVNMLVNGVEKMLNRNKKYA